MKIVTFILGCIIGWGLWLIATSLSPTKDWSVSCNNTTFEHTWLDGAPFYLYNQYRDTIESKDYLRKGVEAYYHCEQCSKIKIVHQNGDINIFIGDKK